MATVLWLAVVTAISALGLFPQFLVYKSYMRARRAALNHPMMAAAKNSERAMAVFLIYYCH